MHPLLGGVDSVNAFLLRYIGRTEVVSYAVLHAPCLLTSTDTGHAGNYRRNLTFAPGSRLKAFLLLLLSICGSTQNKTLFFLESD